MGRRKLKERVPYPSPANPNPLVGPVDAKSASDKKSRDKRTATLREQIMAAEATAPDKSNRDRAAAAAKARTLSRRYKIPSSIRDDIGLTRDEILSSAPVLAAAVRPLPPVEPLPPSWRKYFAQMCRYSQAVQFRHRLATKHDLPIDWYDVPTKGGLSDVFNAVFLDADAVAITLGISDNAATRLMTTGLIPSFKGPSLPLMTTIHDLTTYLSMNRLIDWRVVMYQAGWKAGLGGMWRDPSNGEYIPLTAALAKVKERIDVKFGAKLA